MFDVRNAAASPKHERICGRYERIYTLIDFAAATTFVVGSSLFFFETQQIPATWAFLIGSILFAARPTVTVLREFHLAQLPLPGDGHPPGSAEARRSTGRTVTEEAGPRRSAS
jgi:hypothetical protein